ncbi:MAG: FKBP-type peptidyl-prolyl cis-trans isomerase [Bradymonadaceae bacterium]|nr:FKBP-type peptidyl-prolyl cis-trans isomerase [Lujinxingiaceae bacterium]
MLIAVGLIAAGCDKTATPETVTKSEESTTEKTVENTPNQADQQAANEKAADEKPAAPKADSGVDPLAAPANVAAAPDEAEKTASGLASKVLVVGSGTTHPTATSVVTVHYTGWTTDGKRFDSSVERGETIAFPLNRVIAGWTEGVQLMVVGEKRRFWIPEALAYQGRPGAPAGMLVFDVELFEIQ